MRKASEFFPIIPYTHLDDIFAASTTSAPSAARRDPMTGALPPSAHRGSATGCFFASRTSFWNSSLLPVNLLKYQILNNLYGLI